MSHRSATSPLSEGAASDNNNVQDTDLISTKNNDINDSMLQRELYDVENKKDRSNVMVANLTRSMENSNSNQNNTHHFTSGGIDCNSSLNDSKAQNDRYNVKNSDSKKTSTNSTYDRTPASSYEETMRIVLGADSNSYRQKSVSEVGLENEREENCNTVPDYNTVAEIAYEESESNHFKKEVRNSVSWSLAKHETTPVENSEPNNDTRKIENEKYTVVGNSVSFDKNANKEQEKMPHQHHEPTYGGNSSSILRNGTSNSGFFGDEITDGGNTSYSRSTKDNGNNEDKNSTKKENFQEDPLPPTEESFIEYLTDGACFFFAPKVHPLPFITFLALTIYAAIPAVLYILTFTKIGYGLQVFSYIDTNMEPIAYYFGVVAAIFGMSLYLLDIFYWRGHCGQICRRICYGILSCLLFSFIISLSSVHPYGPVGIFLIVTTSWMVAVRQICFNNVLPKVYISWLSGPLFVVSMGVALYWFGWTLAKDENEWNLINNLSSAEAAGCKPNFDEYPQCDLEGYGEVCFEVNADESTISFEKNCEEICTNVYDECLNSFIVWGGPFLVSVGFFFLSFVASFLRGDGTAEQNIGKLAQSWMFLLFSMWISSCLAGAGTGVSTTLTALTFSAFAASAVFMIGGYNAYEREERLLSLWDKIVEKYGSMLDYVRGLLIITSTPVGLIYIFISFVRQFLRNLKFCYNAAPVDTKSLKHIGGAGWVTVEARRLIRLIKSWDRVQVFTIAIYWGIAFMVLSVIVSEFSILFLSYIIEKTSEMNIALVTAILSFVGLIMFLLPPVPGVPIYLTLGIVIIPVGRDRFGVLGSIIYAMIVSLCLKLLACTLQQKMIGGLLQHKVSVRQFVGINTPLIRSMKLVLAEKGFGIAKVAILIGGPDWPTSVLCGIMNLPLIPILVGTLPIIFLILPTLLTGAFTYMANLRIEENGQQEFPWAATMATVCAAITGIVQFGSMVVAAYFVEKAVSTRAQELETLPIDQEVKEADDKKEEEDRAYREVTQWHRVPIFAKCILYTSLACMIFCCYMVQLFADDCFVEYQLTYTIDQHLDGKWTNIVKPLGLVSLILFSTSVLLLQIFIGWAKKQAASGAITSEPNYPEMERGYSERIDKNDNISHSTNYVRAPE